MKHPRFLVRVAAATLALSMLVAIAGTGTASATTGPTKFLPASHYKVGSALERLYVGQYFLKSVATGSRLTGGAMGIEIDNNGFLYGVAQFYGYDLQGYKTTWTATLYNFHQTKQLMTYDLLGPSAKVLLGRIFVTRAKSGDLTGRIQLVGYSGQYNINWHKISTR